MIGKKTPKEPAHVLAARERGEGGHTVFVLRCKLPTELADQIEQVEAEGWALAQVYSLDSALARQEETMLIFRRTTT